MNVAAQPKTRIERTTEEALLEAFAARAEKLPGAEHAAIRAAREAAMAAFAEAGLPHRRIEAWKYTDLRARLTALPPLAEWGVEAAAPEPTDAAFAGLDAHAVLIADGTVMGGAGVPEGKAELRRLCEAARLGASRALEALKLEGAAHPVAALVAAFAADGLVVTVRKGARLALPLSLVFRSASRAPKASFVRFSLRLEEGAEAVLVEDHGTAAGPGRLALMHTDIVLEAGARLAHMRLQDEGAGATNLARTEVTLGRAAHYVHGFLTQGAALSRHELVIGLEGPGAEASLVGGYLAEGGRHIDTTTLVRHAAPQCLSRQTVKGVVAPGGRGVFQGLVSVARGAAGTNGHQLAKALLLGPRAEVDQKPELEILADDVKCSHGTSVGEIDADALFYLRARGIAEGQARAMLIRAFLGEVFDGCAASFGEALAGVLVKAAEARLARMTGGGA